MMNNLQYQLVTSCILPQRTGGMGGGIVKLRGLGLNHSTTSPDVASALNLGTKSDSGTLMLSYPVLRSREQNFSVRGGLAFFNTETDSGGLLTDKYSLRTAKLGMSFDNRDSARGINLIDVEITKGFDALGAREDLLLTGDNVDFAKASLYAARLQSMAPRWSLLMAILGQYTGDHLLSSERFGIGGEQFLRAYDNSELLGDSGIAGKLELRYNFSLSKAPATAYLYGESGKVWQKNVGAPQTTENAKTLGLGLRTTIASHLNAYIEVAKPFGRDVDTEGDRGTRVFGGLSYVF